MATAASLDSGSRFCTSCEGDGISVEAYSYCFNCDSLFCVSCDKSHGKFAKDHKVVVGDDMPELDTDEKIVFVPCGLHFKENMDLYCKDHEVALCNACKHTVHRKCDVHNFSSAFEEVDVSKWRDEVSTRVMTLLGNADETNSNNKLLLKKVNENTDEMRNNIDYLRTEINNVFDRYIEQLNAQRMSKSDFITDNSKACKSMTEHLKNQRDTLESKENKGNRFKEISTLIETNKLCKEYGTVLQEQDVKMINDSKTPCITGCCFIPNGRLVVCDNNNQTVKFLDKDMKINFTIPCSDGPWDVDCLNEGCIVVTIPERKSIQFIDIKLGIKPKYIHYIGHKAYGVAVNGERMFVSMADTILEKQRLCGVKILNKDGKYVAFIEHIGSGSPQNICTNVDGTKMYYSGGYGTSLFINCFAREGYGLYSVRTNILKSPRSLICDDDENLIVCDDGTKRLHVIDSSGVVSDTILSEQDISVPQSMCFDKINGILNVVSQKEKVVKLTAYKLEY